MIQHIQKIINQIINIGISPDISWRHANRIQITNSLLVFAFPLLVINLIVNLIQQDIWGLTLGGIWFLLALTIPISNSKGKHYITFILLVALFTIMTDIVHIILGISAYLSSLYVVCALMVLFFFETRKEYIIGFVYLIVNYIGTHYYLLEYGSIKETPSGIDVHLYFVFAITAIVAITLKVLNENKKQLNEKERLLNIVETKRQELERFAYITSHDLKEPLRSIAIFSELLQRRLGEKADVITQEQLNFIQSSAVQLNKLTDSVMDYVEISNAKAMEVSCVDMNIILKKVKINLCDKLKTSNCQIIYPTLPTLNGIENQLIILFQHIIDNGIKFNKSPQPIINITFSEMPSHFHFSIKDNGIGIQPEYFEKIFQPFKKLHNKAFYDGAGIGLAISKRIVEQHHGTIEIESRLKEGTIISFTIKK